MSSPRQPLPLSYVLPLAATTTDDDLDAYLDALADLVDDAIVVDGSPEPVFAANDARWPSKVRHVRPGPMTPVGKVAGVCRGLELAVHDRVVIADDDVRWAADSLEAACARLPVGGVLRPQNVFVPAPWHARWDTGRILINRAFGGDWPGTLLVDRRAVTDGYDGASLFENLELVRTVRAAGGQEVVALDLVVPRRPPTTRHFLSQRVRQAYDELARPWRLLPELAIAPALLLGGRRSAAALGASAVFVAEIGRRRGGGADHWPPTAGVWAPAWLAERAVTSWLAVAERARGGVRYRGRRVAVAARPMRRVRADRQRLAAASEPVRPLSSAHGMGSVPADRPGPPHRHTRSRAGAGSARSARR